MKRWYLPRRYVEKVSERVPDDTPANTLSQCWINAGPTSNAKRCDECMMWHSREIYISTWDKYIIYLSQYILYGIWNINWCPHLNRECISTVNNYLSLIHTLWHQVRYRGISVNTNHLYNICTILVQHRRRWADVVQIMYKCFMFASIYMSLCTYGNSYCYCWCI